MRRLGEKNGKRRKEGVSDKRDKDGEKEGKKEKEERAK